MIYGLAIIYLSIGVLIHSVLLLFGDWLPGTGVLRKLSAIAMTAVLWPLLIVFGLIDGLRAIFR